MIKIEADEGSCEACDNKLNIYRISASKDKSMIKTQRLCSTCLMNLNKLIENSIINTCDESCELCKGAGEYMVAEDVGSSGYSKAVSKKCPNNKGREKYQDM